MPSSSPEPSVAGPSLADRIQANARAFDAPSLVSVLREAFPRLPIRFASHDSRSTHDAIVHAVDFAPDHVTITLNLGQGSATSPLPSYFLELLADPGVGPALACLLGIADDRLL